MNGPEWMMHDVLLCGSQRSTTNQQRCGCEKPRNFRVCFQIWTFCYVKTRDYCLVGVSMYRNKSSVLLKKYRRFSFMGLSLGTFVMSFV